MLYRDIRGVGNDLVLVHGWGMNAAIWGELGDDLAREHRVTRLELPGHGASPLAPGMDSLEEWARACLAAAPERAVWIGWSLGGLVAMQAALLAPERFSALVMVAATPRFVAGQDWPDAMSEETLEQFAEALLRDPEMTLDRFLALQVRGAPEARGTLRLLRAGLQGRPAPDPKALRIGLALLQRGDLRRELPGLQPPSLWLLGTRDTLVPRTLADSLPLLLPSARVGLLEGAGHAPFLSHAGPFRGYLREFLQ